MNIVSTALRLKKADEAMKFRALRIKDFPPPPGNKIGWPWMNKCLSTPNIMPNGKPWPKISIVTPKRTGTSNASRLIM